jgi:hypothetical protein
MVLNTPLCSTRSITCLLFDESQLRIREAAYWFLCEIGIQWLKHMLVRKEIGTIHSLVTVTHNSSTSDENTHTATTDKERKLNICAVKTMGWIISHAIEACCSDIGSTQHTEIIS